jgi:15-cis-phytoene desaturase
MFVFRHAAPVVLCAVAFWAAFARASPPLHPRASDSLPSVAILGGGIGGLTAAQELAQRGFSVTVYEALSQLGGKARSFGATGTGKDGREDLPAEHGFRVFAGEYGATRDVMKNIPFNRYSRTNVEQNLVEGRRAIMASKDSPAQFIVPSSFPRSADDFKVWVDYFETVDKYLQPDERDFFLKRIAIVKSFCIERRFAEFENVTWWEYMHADRFSPEYQNLVQMISGTILAANPRNANAHIVGTLAADIIDRTLVPGDRGILIMLDGPTSDMWIEPWVQHLRSLGVVFQLNTTLTSFEMSPDGSRVTAAAVEYNGKRQSVVADVFFSAVPAEKMARVLSQSPDVLLAAPSLRQVDQLMTAWMVVRFSAVHCD